MLIGVCAVLLGALFYTAGACRSRPSTAKVRGRHPVGSSQVVRRLDAAGWIASIVGALAIGGPLWDSRPGLSIAIVVSVLVLVNGLPSLLATVLHGPKARS
ncbi:hypothetical protein M2280_002372 [Prescottella agglutinans]|uniref:SdpI family protein n=1 Tax=Prescottella agglutinans TaxID=1644129 RepID=A0ABT6MA25_9NOCA|nr:hypothetical protein [Prescottella agglutinans]